MRYIQKRQRYEASNFSFQPDGQIGISYNWWIFSREVNGVLVFNNTTYSTSTTKHQSKGYSHLSRKPDIVLYHTRNSLDSLESALTNEIVNIKREIKSIIEAMNKPRSHKRKNEERKSSINYYIKRIKEIEVFSKDRLGITIEDTGIITTIPTTLIAERLYSNIAANTGDFLVLGSI
jgi:hypothetical protein